MSAAPAPASTLTDAYAHCEAQTRAAAANFYYGIRLLPPDKRRAMCAVYAFARRIDDIGDEPGSAEDKLARLTSARAELDGSGDTLGVVALRDAERRFALPHDALAGLIDGVEMDVAGRRYESFDELVVYCRHVAGTIGRLCVAIFGARDRAAADRLADELGVAMQLTNILRDVREDLGNGRVYLPAEDLAACGCPDLHAPPPAAFAALVALEAGRARARFAHGLELMELLDGRSAACLAAMTGIYRRILTRIEDAPGVVLERRCSLPPWEKTWVMATSLAGGLIGSAVRRSA